MSNGIHSCVSYQVTRKGVYEFRIDYCHIGRYLEIGKRILDSFFVVGDDRKCSNLRSCAGCGRNGAEFCLVSELGHSEYPAHLLKARFGMLVLDPHGLRRVYGRTASDSHYPIRLKRLHCLSAAHDGLHGWIGFNAGVDLDFHACFGKIADRFIKEALLFHAFSANADHCPPAIKLFERFKRARSVVYIPWESESVHK